jgi:hypothetical protein
MTNLPDDLVELIERQTRAREEALAPHIADLDRRLAELYAHLAEVTNEITSLQAKRDTIRASAGLPSAPAVATKTTLREAVLYVLSDGEWLTRDQIAAKVDDAYPGHWHGSSVGAALTELTRDHKLIARSAKLGGEKHSAKEYRVT